MDLERERRGDVLARHHFNIDSRLTRFGTSDGTVQLATGGDSSHKPVVTPEGRWYLLIIPRRHIVVGFLSILTEQAFNQVAMIIEDKNDGLESVASELAHFLRSELMGTFPRDQHGPVLRGGNSGPKGCWSGPADGAPESLIVKDGVRRHPREGHAHRGGACLGDQDIMRLEKLLPTRIEILSGDFPILRALGEPSPLTGGPFTSERLGNRRASSCNTSFIHTCSKT